MEKIKQALLGDNRLATQIRIIRAALPFTKGGFWAMAAIFVIGTGIFAMAYEEGTPPPPWTVFLLIAALLTGLLLMMPILRATIIMDAKDIPGIQRELDDLRGKSSKKAYPFVRAYLLCLRASDHDELGGCRSEKIAEARNKHGEEVANEIEVLFGTLEEKHNAPSEEVAPYLRDYHACCADQYRNLTASECRAAIVKSARDADGEKAAQKVAQVIDRQYAKREEEKGGPQAGEAN